MTGQRHSLARIGIRGSEEPAAGEEADVAAAAGGVPDAVLELRDDAASVIMFIPHQVVAEVSEQGVTLRVDEPAVRGRSWAAAPTWVRGDVRGFAEST